MFKNKKNKRFLILLCSMFVIFASIFSFLPFDNSKYIVKADSVLSDYSFYGSNISSATTFEKGNFSDNLFKPISNGTRVSNGISINVDSTSTSTFSISGTSTANLGYNLLDPNYTLILKSGVTYTFSMQNFVNLGDDFVIATQVKKMSDDSLIFNFVNPKPTEPVVSVTPSYDVQVTRMDFYVSGIKTIDTSFNLMFEESTGYSPYVPYNNILQVNYDFDFRVLNSNYTNFTTLEFGIGYNIQDTNGYTYASIYSYEGDRHIRTINDLIPIAYSFLPSCSFFTFYRYDFNNIDLDPNYSFRLYYAFDYIQSYDNLIPFNGNIKYVVIGSYKDRDSYFHFDNYAFYDQSVLDFLSNEKYNFISYVDENGNNLNFFIPLDSFVDGSYFVKRTYFLSEDSVGSAMYEQGFVNGFSSGENKGYTDGYNVGKNDGYNLGYNTALENDDRYSFTNLIASVIDVPVNTFTSLLNFEILGVNLSGFFLGLLTCCIILGVIRLIL